MSGESVFLDRADGLARITLDRAPLNVLDIAMLDELAEAIEAVADPQVNAVLLTGAGKAFCAGVSVEDHTPERVDAMIGAFHGVIDRLLGLSAPVISAVNGAALGGGCELALACDVVWVKEGAKIGQPEIGLGVFPPAAAVLLPRLIGRQRAMDLVLSGRVVESAEAVQLGLASRVIPAEAFDDDVTEQARILASRSRPVLRLAKRAVREGAEGDAGAAMRHVERLYLEDLMALEDAREGLAAFVEKRAPVWKGG